MHRSRALPKRFKLPYNLKLPEKEEKLQQLLGPQVDAFSEKVKQNPYAAMLRTPLRLCTFHNRVMPAAFLSRFTTGVDVNTNTTWAVPTLGESHERGMGQGRYVLQNKQVLHWFDKTARHKYTFRNKAIYRSDMIDYIQSNLSYTTLSTTNDNLNQPSLMAILNLETDTWTARSSNANDTFSYALHFGPSTNDTTNDPIRSFQGISNGDTTQKIPFYNVEAMWGAAVAENLRKQFVDIDEVNHAPLAIAFKHSSDALKNSLALWKFAGFLRHVDHICIQTQTATQSS